MTQYMNARQQGHLFRRKGTGDYTGDFVTEAYTFANCAAGSDTSLVSQIVGSRIRVLSYSLSCVTTGPATVIFYSGPSASARPRTQTISLAANQFVTEASEVGLFDTVAGDNLTVVATTNIVGVRVTYIYVD